MFTKIGKRSEHLYVTHELFINFFSTFFGKNKHCFKHFMPF